jgi:ferric-dicitrate binding protein FerR (iron transport regulator)
MGGSAEASSVKLAAGQQAVIKRTEATKVTVQTLSDPQQVIDWKNGMFNLEGADLKSVMRQLERWYKIDVKYGDKLENVTFRGKVFRDSNLSEVLKVLSLMDVKFKMEGNTLYVN